MYTLGIDIGSTTSKCVILKDGETVVCTTLHVGGIGTVKPDELTCEIIEKAGLKRSDITAMTATGYGRTRYEEADYQVSELTCHALGAHMVFPTVRTIIDIGGQDAKVISLNDQGRMQDFLMNDKCAAGTGRFLDVMATILGIPIGEMQDYALRSTSPVTISNTCTVFAESEVISQLANGVNNDDLVAGICNSVASRVAALVKRRGVVPDVCMSGGVAQNGGVRHALEVILNTPILFSEDAQLFGAMGAAKHAWQKESK